MSGAELSLLVLTTSFPRFRGDEASIFVGRLVDGFGAAGMKGTVVVPSDAGVQEEDRWGSFRMRRYRYGVFCTGRLAFGNGIFPNLRKNPFLFFQAPMLLLRQIEIGVREKRSYQVVHGNWVISALPAYFIRLLVGVPYVITLRGEDAKLLQKPLLRSLFRFLLSRAYRVVTVAEHLRIESAELLNLPENHFVCIPNGTLSREPFKAAERKKQLLYVGRLISLKRPEVLLSLMELQCFKDYTLLLVGRVGDRYRAELEKLIQEGGLEGRVTITGAVPPEKVSELLASSRYYVSASTHEGRSNSMVEALAAGVPVIASDIPGHREAVSHTESGFLFQDDGFAALEKWVLYLEESPEDYKRCAEAAQRSPVCITPEEAAQGYKELFLTASHGKADAP